MVCLGLGERPKRLFVLPCRDKVSMFWARFGRGYACGSPTRRLGKDLSRYRCKQIGSWAIAQELLKQGHSYLDGDGDGEACESLK